MTYAVEFRAVSRHFGTVKAVDAVDLQIAEGTFFAMLGPSGSGKTTCLRLISGFERPQQGQICLFGEDISQVPPHLRNVNTVFQDYALFPHMSILENVAYGLMVKGVGRIKRLERAEEVLALVHLRDFAMRKPSQLSGGQRQRVALARALINEPKVLLLDEPLGALDLKLREAMQGELKTLQRKLGITFIFVTHDQSEALSMADQVAVFRNGKIAQIGTPREIYSQPQTRFVADFVGSSNVVPPDVAKHLCGVAQWMSVRPETIFLGQGAFSGKVTDLRYLGATTRVCLEFKGWEIVALIPSDLILPKVGQVVPFGFDTKALHAMAGE